MSPRPSPDRGPRPGADGRDGGPDDAPRPLRDRAADDHDDITGLPSGSGASLTSASTADVFGSAGASLGGMVDRLGAGLGAVAESVGGDLEAAGRMAGAIGEVIAGATNPWQSDQSSGGERDSNPTDTDDDDGGPRGGGKRKGNDDRDASQGHGDEISTSVRIDFATAAATPADGPVVAFGADDATTRSDADALPGVDSTDGGLVDHLPDAASPDTFDTVDTGLDGIGLG